MTPEPAAIALTADGVRFPQVGTVPLGWRRRRVLAALAATPGRCVAYSDILSAAGMPDTPAGRHTLCAIVSEFRTAAADLGEFGVICVDRGFGYALTRPVTERGRVA